MSWDMCVCVCVYLLGLNMLDSWKQCVASGWDGTLTFIWGFMAAGTQAYL